MTELKDLYQQIIFDHSKFPHNFGILPNANREALGFNSFCSDQIKVYLKIDDRIIQAIKFDGKGCAISVASASIMTDLVLYKTENYVIDLFNQLHSFIVDNNSSIILEEKLMLFENIKNYPMRVKCLMLPWHALIKAIKITSED